ncbi:MAG TPA: hypothetical protein VMB46_07230 [Methanomassiliicoccales archaeon]|nr:hypothetical protein [Methanomassiliicoccales archaeon]
MACVSCGSETKPGVLMCAECLSRIDDPTNFLLRMQDPAADARLFQRGSPMIRIGPVVGEDLQLGRGIEPALRLRALLEKKDKEPLGAFIDKYLASAGVRLHLWGDERLPKRSMVWSVVNAAKGKDESGPRWARAHLRAANVHVLIVKRVLELPVDPDWLAKTVAKHSGEAEMGFAQARLSPDLASISDSNLALLCSWTGKRDEALALLEPLSDKPDDKNGSLFTIKKAIVLSRSGRNDEALAALGSIPLELMDVRALALKARLEGMR